MPPKRKMESNNTSNKRANVAPKAARKNTSKASLRSPSTTDAGNRIKKFCESWFDQYKDADDPNIISPEGCEAFFKDIDVSLDSIFPILIGWKLNASRMGYFTREEWMNGMVALGIDSHEKMKQTLERLEKEIQNEEVFKKLYLYTFGYAKTAGQKSMDVDVAIALWQVMLDESRYPHISHFISFLQEQKPVKIINKDQWSSLLDFCRSVPTDLSNYDSTSSWPVLFDDYVEWRLKQTQ